MEAKQRDLALGGVVVDAVNKALASPYLAQLGISNAGDVRLIDAEVQGSKITINLSRDILRYGLGSDEFEKFMRHIHFMVGEAVRDQFTSMEFFTLIEGEPLHTLFPKNHLPVEKEGAGPVAPESSSASVSGKRVAISPGHGYYFNVNTSIWTLQRNNWFGIVEDFVNSEIAAYLSPLLAAQGATVRTTRELNKSAGTGDSGRPKWQEAARYYIKSLGVPASVWNTSASTSTNDQLDDDIRSRPLYANWVDANGNNADILISIHNNGANVPGTGTGTETLYDTTNGHQVESKRLADILHATIVGAIRAGYNSVWVDRRVQGFDGDYGENRIATRPSVIVEIAFMDRQSPDNAALQDEQFKSLVAQAISQGVAEYFGGATTLPDLVVTALTAPSTGIIGGQITISSTVANQGTASASAYRLGFYFWLVKRKCGRL
jgi:N-acetylmuramoyl-L-alanine amidase